MMMQRNPYFTQVALFVTTMAFAVNLQAGGPGPRPAQLFHSYSGDVSDIRLRMHEDQSFILEMYLVAFDDFVIMKGVWTDRGDRWELTFTQNRPTIQNLFEDEMIVGPHTFKIGKHLDEFFIYGTLCTRSGSAGIARLSPGK